MTRWMWLGGVLLVLGCAAPRSLALRERYRAQQAAETLTAAEAPAYRATEAVRGARWGMTPDELLAARGEPRERQGETWVYAEEFEGVTVSSGYLFVRGQLAAIRTAWSREELPRERLEAALSSKYGPPVSRADLQVQLREHLDAAHREEAALAWLGVAGHGVVWPSPSRQELERELVEARTRPLLRVRWHSPETAVELLSADGQRSLVTWRSRRLAGLLAEREAGGTVPEALRDKM